MGECVLTSQHVQHHKPLALLYLTSTLMYGKQYVSHNLCKPFAWIEGNPNMHTYT